MHDQLCSLVYMASTILHTPATSVRRGNGGGGGKGALLPLFLLMYAYTAKSHGAETIRDNL